MEAFLVDLLNGPIGIIVIFIMMIALFAAFITFISTIFEFIYFVFVIIYYGIKGFFKLVGYLFKQSAKFLNK